jgi:hypothetical protein
MMIRSAAMVLAVASMAGGVSAAAAGTAQCGHDLREACRPVAAQCGHDLRKACHPIAASDELSSATRRPVRRPLRIEVRRPYFLPGPPAAMPPNYYLFVNGRLSGPYYYARTPSEPLIRLPDRYGDFR